MLKKNKGLMILTSVIILLPVVAGLLLWDKLPEAVPAHWNINGEPDGWSSRPVAVFGLPLLLLAVHWLGLWIVGQDRKNKHTNAKAKALLLWLVPAISLIGNGSVYAAVLGADIALNRLVFLFLGLLFTVIGNYLPKCKQNYTIGIKIVWTLNSEENWNATHRMAGKVWMAGGVLLMLCGFVPAEIGSVMLPVTLGLMVGAPILYSWQFSRRKEGDRK